PAIYTLSLHDALPIWDDCDTQTMTDQEFLHSSIHGSLLAVISKSHRGYWLLLVTAWTWAIWSCAEYWRGNPNYSYGWIVPVLGLDRKSTRLNSSHRTI